MIRSLSFVSLVALVALAGLGPAFASSPDSAGPATDELSTPVEAPFALTIRDRSWNGDPHAMPVGRAVLEAHDQRVVWELADVTMATASADGSTVALLTRDYQVFVSRLPESPRPIDGGPYLIPALSRDGTLLVAQRLGPGGHILDKTVNTQGIALVDVTSGEDRLLVEGDDLYSPSFASDEMVFFGSGGPEQYASLYLLDLRDMSVARVTNREKDARQTFPSGAPRLLGGRVVYRADGELFRVPLPAASDFVAVHRFDSPQDSVAAAPPQVGVGPVRLRRPNTGTTNPPIWAYFDLDKNNGRIKDWNCGTVTYDGHLGTDFNQNFGDDVVAPASGLVVRRYNGCANYNSQGCGKGFGNHVTILHEDGTASLEAHGKKDTVIALGSPVSCGQKIMETAASGNANNDPHVHHVSFANYLNKYLSPRIDPFEGSCDPNDASLWSTQNGYKVLPGTTCTH